MIIRSLKNGFLKNFNYKIKLLAGFFKYLVGINLGADNDKSIFVFQ